MAQRKSLPPLAVIIKSPSFSVTRVASPVSSNAKTSATRAASGLVLLALGFVLWVVDQHHVAEHHRLSWFGGRVDHHRVTLVGEDVAVASLESEDEPNSAAPSEARNR